MDPGGTADARREELAVPDTTMNSSVSEKDCSYLDVQNEPGPDEDFSDVDEKKVLRKMDLRLIPQLALLYLLSFLDRGNIGNAKIEGLEDDLKLKGGQYNWCCTCLYHGCLPWRYGIRLMNMSISDCLLFHIRHFRNPVQRSPEKVTAIDLYAQLPLTKDVRRC